MEHPARQRLEARRCSTRSSQRRGRGRSTATSSRTRPAESTTTRLARNTASPTSWVMKMTVGRRSCQMRVSSSWRVMRVCASTLAKGSSIKQHVGLVGEGAGDADALLHAPGQLVGVAVGGVARAGQRQELAGDRLALRLADAAHLRAEGDVLEHRLPREQREGLEHDAAVRPRAPAPAGRRPGCRPRSGR